MQFICPFNDPYLRTADNQIIKDDATATCTASWANTHEVRAERRVREWGSISASTSVVLEGA
jgi:hypothetical protein